MKPLAADDPRTAGEFRLRARLGAGGMGVVYLGFSPAGRAVAVKVVQPGLAGDQQFLARFRQEVAAVRAVSGFYAAPVVAAGPDDHPPWLATAFVPGPPLDEVIAAHGPLPEDALWRLAAGLTEALSAIHGSGVIHRDLKPSNVLLAMDGPRLIDFGISRAADGSALTATGQVFGSPGYMSPEQAEGSRVGPASDVFSLGCVLAFAATGRRPFGEGNPAVLIYRVVHGQPALDGMPPRLRDLAVACLAKDPSARPTLGALAQVTRGGPDQEPTGTSFWPGPVARVLAGYQARTEADLRALMTGSQPVLPAPGQEASERPDHGVSRRWLLTAGAISAAGLGVAGWRSGIFGGPSQPGSGAGSGSGSGAGSGSSTGAASRPAGGRAGSGAGPQWTFPAGGLVQTSLAVANGLLYAGTDNGWIYAIGTAGGRRRWYFHAESQVQAGPVVYDGLVYAADLDGTLYALDADTGRLRWHYSLGPPGTSAPVPGAGLIFLAGETQALYALDARTGAVRRQIATTYDVNQDLVGAAGLIYTGDNPGSVLAFRQDGTPAWSTPVTTGALRPMAVAGGTVYAPDSSGTVHALNAATGRRRWSKTPPLVVGGTPAIAEAPPVVAGDTVAVVGGENLYAFDVRDGRLAWQFPVGNGLARPAASGGLIYVASLDAISALDPAHGRQVWSYGGDLGVVQSGIAVESGVVYVGDGLGNILALRT